MEQKLLLTTEDIRQMTLKEFMGYKQERDKVIACSKFQTANSTWLLVSDLEAVDSMKKLKQLTKQIKEDLWWGIHNRRIGQDE